jgi:transporter family protein
MIYEAIGVGIMGFAVLIFVGFRPEVHVKGMSLAVLTGILGIGGALGFLFAVKAGKVSIVAMFIAMAPVLTILLATIFLREPITLKEGLGILFALAALFLFAS